MTKLSASEDCITLRTFTKNYYSPKGFILTQKELLELEEKVKADQQEVDTYEQNKSDFDSFAAIIRKYVGIKELTPAIVNEFIKKIIVHAPEKVDGKRVQKVDIVFNFVGEINFLSVTQPKRQGA